MKMKLGFGLMATLCILFNQVLSNADDSNAEFSSLLKTVVEGPITPPFRIHGPNGLCAYAHNYNELILFGCTVVDLASRFTFHDDGTLRVNGRCLTARGFTQGSLVQPAACTNTNLNSITWRVNITERQIVHRSTGLVLSAVSGASRTPITLQTNVFSWYQTWRLDYNTPVPTAHILGMNGLCLMSSNDQVWLGTCGISFAGQRWRVYPDGTIRPQQRAYGCLSFDSSSRVLVTVCGLSATAERWVLTRNGAILNERFNLVLDVEGADPSRERILVYPPSGGANQQWRIFYD